MLAAVSLKGDVCTRDLCYASLSGKCLAEGDTSLVFPSAASAEYVIIAKHSAARGNEGEKGGEMAGTISRLVDKPDPERDSQTAHNGMLLPSGEANRERRLGSAQTDL